MDCCAPMHWSPRRSPERTFDAISSKISRENSINRRRRGEISAVPVLLRRLCHDEAQAWGVEITRPHRRPRSQLVKQDAFQKAVRVAGLASGTVGILVLFDADDDCPAELAPKLGRWAHDVADGRPCPIVMANREYEAWFLSSIESLRGRRGIREDAASFPEPEGPRDAKGRLERCMDRGASYSPTLDQAALTAGLDFASAYRGCRSFRKLVSVIGTLLQSAGVCPVVWPPADWRQPALPGR